MGGATTFCCYTNLCTAEEYRCSCYGEVTSFRPNKMKVNASGIKSGLDMTDGERIKEPGPVHLRQV